MGSAFTWIFNRPAFQFNPRQQSVHSFIDAKLLEHFGEMTATLFEHDVQHHSPQWIKQQFLQKAIAQMQSTDGIYHLKDLKNDFKQYFKNQNGRILPEATQKLVDAFLNPPELSSKNLETFNAFETKLRGKLGTLDAKKICKTDTTLKIQTPRITNSTINQHRHHGRPTHRTHLPLKAKAGQTKLTPMAERSLADYLSKVKHYCDAFLTPAIDLAEKNRCEKLTPETVQTMRHFLFHETQTNWLTKLFKINPKDGLLRLLTSKNYG